jgi:quinol monooxygenase YgiN
MSVVVLLELQVKPEEVDNIKAYLKEILPDTRSYEGCQELDIYGNLDESTNFAQFIADCSSSKWSKHVTNSPFLALLATAGSSAAYKIISACSNAVN